MKPTTHRREAMHAARVKRHALSSATAAEAIGPIEHGCEIFGLNGGQFSLIDIIEHCLNTTGPADVLISTWTAANSDMKFAMGFIANGAIKSLRFLVDFSFPTRQPEYCSALRERFGDNAIRLTKTHCKFVTIRNGEWSIVIRSSMNLNENRRLESFEISDDEGMADYLHEIVDRLWADHEDGAQFKQTPYQRCKDFEVFASEGAIDPGDEIEVTDKKYFGDGPSDTDLRRCGMTTSKGGKIP